MICMENRFMDSPFFVDEPGNWHLKEGAPEEVVREFEDFMAARKKLGYPQGGWEIPDEE